MPGSVSPQKRTSAFIIPFLRKNTLHPFGQRASTRGTTSGLPLSHDKRPHGVPSHPGAVTGAPGTALIAVLPVRAAAPGCISRRVPSPSHQNGGSLGGTCGGTSPCHRNFVLCWIIVCPALFVKRNMLYPGARAVPSFLPAHAVSVLYSTKSSFCEVSCTPLRCPAVRRRH